MNRLTLFTLTALFLVPLASLHAAEIASHPADPYANDTPEQRDARMAWWREARFGLFIHWGVYAVPAGIHQGNFVEGYGEWIKEKGRIPTEEYKAYPW